MKKNKENIKNPCSECMNLNIFITANGMKPQCKKKVFRFKERILVDWKNDMI